MKTIKETLELALEVLITINNAIYVNSQQEADAFYKANDAITALRVALASQGEALTSVPNWASEVIEQPAQQEPVGWQYRDSNDDGTWGGWLGCDKRLAEDKYRQVRALYASPQPAPVQQEPVAVVSGYYGGQCVILPIDPARIFNSNTALYTSPPAQQEPLEYWNAVEGWVKIDEVRKHFDSVGCGTIYKTAGDGRVPLTAAQRKPLTDDEIWREYRFLWPFHPAEERKLASDILIFARAIEAVLKAKNSL